MSSPAQITSRHRDRLAVIYVRQSTLAQVRENTESTNRQYGLVEKATSLGWDGSNVLVIDGDLGLSGRSSSIRPGFKELVSRVCVGEVGAIFGLEVSRRVWGTKSPSELSGGPRRPATISRRPCSSSSSTPASGSSSTSPYHPSATAPLIRPNSWCCATRSASSNAR